MREKVRGKEKTPSNQRDLNSQSPGHEVRPTVAKTTMLQLLLKAEVSLLATVLTTQAKELGFDSQ